VKYQIIISTSPGWAGKPIVANLVTKLDEFNLSREIWNPGILKNMPELAFSINQTHSLPDIISSGVLWLISNRLSNILKGFGVAFESFPVSLIGSSEIVSTYQLFHLLQITHIVDIQKSEIQGIDNVKSITLAEMDETPELAMVRDSLLQSLVFVREDLISTFTQEHITGCDWMNPTDFSFSLRRKRW